MGDKKQKIIIGLLILNAILIIWVGKNSIKSINNRFNNLNNQIGNLNREMNFLYSNMSNDIQGILDSRESRIDTFDYNYRNIDAANKKATLDLTVKLKATNPYSTIYLVYCEEYSNDVKEID